jgi:hypothetical protein
LISFPQAFGVRGPLTFETGSGLPSMMNETPTAGPALRPRDQRAEIVVHTLAAGPAAHR